MAPGQGRPIVSYLSPPQVSSYPSGVASSQLSKQSALDPMMEALARRLGLQSQTGDMSDEERAITGKDSLGRPQASLNKKGSI